MNRYLQDGFAPVADELTASRPAVTGELPDHLDGRYLRIGPNPADDPGEALPLVPRRRDGPRRPPRGRSAPGGTATAGCAPPTATSPPTPTSSGTPGARWRSSRPARRPTSSTTSSTPSGRCGFAGDLRAGYTAHPHEDPVTGELHAVSYSWTRGNRVDYSVHRHDGRLRRQVEVAGARQPDDARLRASPRATSSSTTCPSPSTSHGHRHDEPPGPHPAAARPRSTGSSAATRCPTRRRRMARGGGARRRCPTRGTTTTPPASACCRATAPTARRCAGSRSTPATSSTPSTPTRSPRPARSSSTPCATTRCSRPSLIGPDEGPASLTRFTLDLASGKAREHRYDEHSQEFPRHDERLTGRRHRYGYVRRLRRAAVSATRCCATTRSPAPPPYAASAPGPRPASWCSCRRHPTRPRTTAC